MNNDMSYYIGLSLLSNEGIDEVGRKAVRRKFQSAEARRILSIFEDKPVNENDIARETSGRPFLKDRKVDFNICHSSSLTAVSYVKNMRTGCDIELIRPRQRAGEIAQEFFTHPEKKYIFSDGKLDDVKFYMIWTLKECYLKLRGLSVFDIGACPSFIKDNDCCQYHLSFTADVSSHLSFFIYELSGRQRYILSSVIEGAELIQPELRWFSQSSLACKKIAEINAAPSPAETVRPKI